MCMIDSTETTGGEDCVVMSENIVVLALLVQPEEVLAELHVLPCSLFQ